MRDFFSGVFVVIKVVGEPKLYRYPYRNSAEALRADWMRIGDDVRSVMGKIDMEMNDGK